VIARTRSPAREGAGNVQLDLVNQYDDAKGEPEFCGAHAQRDQQDRNEHEKCANVRKKLPVTTRNTRASCEAMMSLKPELSRLSQIDADVSEIGTRAGEADSRMYKPLQNAFGA
jgi:hypothetical protein